MPRRPRPVTDVDRAWAMWMRGMTLRGIAAEFGVHHSTIANWLDDRMNDPDLVLSKPAGRRFIMAATRGRLAAIGEHIEDDEDSEDSDWDKDKEAAYAGYLRDIRRVIGTDEPTQTRTTFGDAPEPPDDIRAAREDGDAHLRGEG